MNKLAQSPTVKSAQRVLEILEFLAVTERRDVSQALLARALSIPKSSLHGILQVLTARGYVERDGLSNVYRLGPRSLALGASYLAGLDLHAVARPIMAEMGRLSRETITLDVLSQGAVVTLAREAARYPVRLVTQVGAPFPAHASATGKVLLASLPDDQIDVLYPDSDLPQWTSTTVRTKQELRAELDEVRRTGVARTHGELFEGFESIAVPVVDHQQRVIAAIDVIVPTSRAEPLLLCRLESLARAGGRLVSAQLGGGGLGTIPSTPEHQLEVAWSSVPDGPSFAADQRRRNPPPGRGVAG